MPASKRMKSAGVGAIATATLPISSMPIQAGEPTNIRIANTSWYRLTGCSARQAQEVPVLHVALAPAQVAADELDQRRRVLLPAVVLVGQHADLVAGAAHQHRLDLVVAEDMAAAERALAEQSGSWQCAMNGAMPDDRVVAPVGAAIALPPGAAERVGAHAEPHAELEDAGEGAGRRHADDQALQDADARIGLHDAHQPQDRVRRS